ncbi:ESPR-type extended signal peptide-containing protein [Acinetobacter sp. 251-1]|uniref:ESPR-type extended signal peptide-containing protein n=1 Tax=Acinetobacter sp. 251-1 TaxID=2746720 RepID=UPI0025770A1A|nr:ESPR-type extended signal peptide-containing protein [Acinetobacter sp. 251-1]MDM1759673.1 YadA-like family protein [Acinetobacter sp. 251-1]
MNHIFKKIWNKSLGRMVVVSENAKNSGKKQHTEGGVSEKITQLNSVHTSVGLAVPLSRTLLATTMLLLGLNSSWAVECLSSVPPSSPSLDPTNFTCGINNTTFNTGSTAMGASPFVTSTTPVLSKSYTLNAITHINGLAITLASNNVNLTWADILANPANLTHIDGKAITPIEAQNLLLKMTQGGNLALGKNSTAVGNNNWASGVNSSSMGSSNLASGGNSNAIGNNNQASNTLSNAIGAGIDTSKLTKDVNGYIIAIDGIRVNTSATTLAELNANTLYEFDQTSGLIWSFDKDAFLALIKNGGKNIANGIGANAIGTSNHVSGNLSIGVGTLNTVNGFMSSTSTAFGLKNTVESDSDAMGTNNIVGDSALGVGRNNSVQNSGIAVGRNNTVGNTGTGLGRNNITGSQANAVGSWNAALGDFSVALGGSGQFTLSADPEYNGTGGTLSSLFGIQITSTVTDIDDLNDINQISEFNGLSGNLLSDDDKRNVIALAQSWQVGNIAAGTSSTALGLNNIVAGTESIAVGLENKAESYHDVALGYQNIASGAGSTAIGVENKASHWDTTAVGYKNEAIGQSSTAIGAENKAQANFSTAIGYQSVANHANATAIGYQAETDRANSVSVGKAGAEKQITHVKAGTANTDAVNLGQVQTLIAAIPTGSTVVNDNYVLSNSGSNALGVATGNQHLTENDGTTLTKVAGIDVTANGLNIDDIISYKIKNPMSGGYLTVTDPTELAAFKNAAKKGGNLAIGIQTNAVGMNNIASELMANAVGVNNTASGMFANSVGTQNTSTGFASTAIGFGNQSTGFVSTAMGFGNTSAGILSNAVGNSITNIPKMRVELDSNNAKRITIDGIDVITQNDITDPNAQNVAQTLTATDIDTINGQSLSLEEKQIFIDLLHNQPPRFNDAYGMLSNALGVGNIASGTQSSAMGVQNTASGHMSNAVGFNNQATALNSSAFGSNSIASHEGATALGNGSETDRVNSISVGKAGAEKQITNVADGTQAKDAVNLSQVQSLIAGGGAGLAVLYDAATKDTVTLGGTAGTKLTNLQDATLDTASMDAVTGKQLNTTNTNLADLTDIVTDTATGLATKASAADLTAGLATRIGYDAGNVDKITLGGTAGTTISNVADGTQAKDAVNLSQVQGLISAIPTGGANADSVLYDTGSNKATITLAGGTAGTKITNLQDATLDANSTDAVTGKQLNAAKTDIASLDAAINDTATGLATKASAADLTALNDIVTDTATGLATKASQADLTAGLATKIGYDSSNTDVITLRGVNGTTISNLTAGVADTDAVNVKQLKDSKTKYFGVNSTNTSTGSNVNGEMATGIGSLAVGVRSQASGDWSSAVGWENNALSVGSVAIGNMNTADASLDQPINQAGYSPFFSDGYSYGAAIAIGRVNTATGAGATAVGLKNTASGTVSSAFGTGAVANKTGALAFGGWYDQNANQSIDNRNLTNSETAAATGVSAVAIGAGVSATADRSSVFGVGSQATAQNATALGFDSLADEANTVSVGRSGAEKRITNVANATKGTDAVNLNTLNQALTSVTGGTGITKNYAHDVSDNALGAYSGTAHTVQKDSTGKITAIDGVTVTTTGAGTSIDDITGFTANGVPVTDPTRVANFIAAAKQGGNIAVGTSSTAVGVQNLASAKNSSAVGYANTSVGQQSSAMGAHNYVSGEGSSAIGGASSVAGRLVSNNGPMSSTMSDMNEIVLKPYGLATNITEIAGITVATTASSWADLINDPSKLTSVNGNTTLTLAEKQAFLQGLQQGANTVIGNANSAIGSQNTIVGKQSSAVGFGNSALGESNSALGLRNFADGKGSNAIGSNNRTSSTSKDASAIGAGNSSTGNLSSAMGSNNTAVGQGSSAIGSSSHLMVTLPAPLSSELGARTPATTTSSGTVDRIDGVAVVTTATNWNDLKSNPSKLTSINGVTLSTENQASVINSLKTGGNIALGKASNAVGSQNIAAAENSSVFGVASIATAKNATAIGYNSVADEENTVSVGKVGVEKRITNVADAVNATDAANKRYVDNALSSIAPSADAVLYDAGSNKAKITLTGGTAGTKITNLQDATLDANSTDAVTGKQLNATNDAVATKASTKDLNAGLALKVNQTDFTALNNQVNDANTGLASKASTTDLNTGLTTTLSTAKGYTDQEVASTLSTAKGYTDQEVASTLSTAKGYTDQEVASTLTTAKGYTDQETASTLSTAKGYTDQETASTLTTAKGYTDQEVASTLSTAKGYTDQEVASTLSTAKGYTDQEVASTLSTAKGYTDQETTSTLSTAKGYTDQKTADAVLYDTGSNKEHITLAGTAGTSISNLKAGVNDDDAVNFGQLKVKADQSTVNALDGRVTTNTNDITALQNGLVGISANAVVYDTVNKDIVRLQGTNGTKLTNLQDATLDITSTDAVTGRQLNAANSNVTALDTRVTQTETDIGTLQTNLGTTQTNLTTLDGRVGTAESNITNLKGDVVQVQSDITTNSTAITGLDTRVTQTETDIDTLQTNLGTTQTNLTTLDGRVGTAENNITNLQGDVGQAQADLFNLSGNVAATQNQVQRNENAFVSSLGGGAAFNNGNFVAPSFTIQNRNYRDVGSALTAVDTKLTNLDTRLSKVETTGGVAGANGLSAYDIAKNNGFTGTETQWLSSLQGAKGDTGANGVDGLNGKDGAKGDKGDQGLTGVSGKDGVNGKDGANGLDGLNGKDGAKGDKGDQGLTGASGKDGLNGKDGANGLDGLNGKDGAKGDKGDQGLSAYDVAVKNGYKGTEQQWLNSQSNPLVTVNADQNNLTPAQATGSGSVAIGDSAVASGNQSTSIGQGSTVTGHQSTAVGKGNIVAGERSGAFGDPNKVSGNNSYAVGNDNAIKGDGTFVLGNNINTEAKNAVVLGNNSASDRDNTVSVGAKDAERQIIHVADATEATDAVNLRQMQAAEAETLKSSKEYTDTQFNRLEHAFSDHRLETDRRFHEVDKRFDRQGAMTAAMMNMANSTSGLKGRNRVGVGAGFQGDEKAVAVGYQRMINDNTSISLGGAMTEEEKSGGVGVGFSW